MVEYRQGMENIPLKEINKSLKILVIVYDLRNQDKPIIEDVIDYGDYEKRKWLGRVSFWAFQNHCSVETMNLTDAEAEQKENEK